MLHESVAILNSSVPFLKQKSDDYDRFIMNIPGFTRIMVVVSDLIYCSDALLACQLNVLLKKKHLGTYTYVSGAISKVRNMCTSGQEKEAVSRCLSHVFGVAGKQKNELD